MTIREIAERIKRAFPEKRTLSIVSMAEPSDDVIQVEWHEDGEDVEIEILRYDVVDKSESHPA